MPSEPEQALTAAHEAAVADAVRRAKRPETFARLLTRAAELLRPVKPTPEADDE